MNRRNEALSEIAELERQVRQLKSKYYLASRVSEEEVKVLRSAAAQLQSVVDWAIGESIHQPRARVELPAETAARRDWEMRTAEFAPRRKTTLVRGISID